jgi:hypothetical protein
MLGAERMEEGIAGYDPTKAMFHGGISLRIEVKLRKGFSSCVRDLFQTDLNIKKNRKIRLIGMSL